jgi:hypothetical protein
VSVALIELFMVLAVLGFAYAGIQTKGTTQPMQQRRMGLFIGALVCLVILLIFNCMLYCYYTQFKIAIAVIDAAADFFADTKRIIFVSLMSFVAQLIFLAIWFAGLGCVYGMNDFKYDPTLDDIG